MLIPHRIRTEKDFEALASEWEELFASIMPSIPFFSPLWNLLYWKHLRRSGPMVHDELFAFAFRDEAGRLVAVAPLMRCRWPGMLWPRARQVRYFGADPNVTEYNGMVCHPDRYEEALRALHSALMSCAGEWDWSHWAGLPPEGGAAEWLARMAEPDTTSARPSYFLDIGKSWDEFRASRPRNLKESLRKCYNSLKRDGHEFEFRVVSAPGEVQAALNVFYELHHARAAASGFSIRHKNVFEQPKSVAFLNEYAAEMARQGRLFIFQILIAGQVIATRIAFAQGTELYLYFSGYRPEWGRYSVMTTTLAEALKWCFDTPYRRIHLSFGTDVSKLRWKPTEYTYMSGLIASPSMMGRLTCALYRAMRQRRKAKAPTGQAQPDVEPAPSAAGG